MTVINDLKQELKGLAKQVSATKVEYKQLQKDKKPYYTTIDQHNRLRTEYRHKHIAYCLVRGKAYEQIEQPKEENRPNMTMVYRYVATVYIKMLEQCSDDYRLVYDILKDEALAKVEHLRKTAQPSVYIHAPAERMQPYAITPKPPTAVQVSQAIKTFNPGVSLAESICNSAQRSEQAATSRSGWSWLSSVFNRTRD